MSEPPPPDAVPPPPDALFFLAPGCPHCPAVWAALSDLLKRGRLGRLEVVNAAARPDLAHAAGVASVPWTRIGPFILEGVHTPAEWERWVDACHSPTGMAVYFDRLFAAGRRHLVERMVREEPGRLSAFAHLLGDPEVGINTRLGVGVVLEELRGSGLAASLVPELGELTRHPDPRIRGDACHYLPLCDPRGAIPYLIERIEDSHPQVREVAREELEEFDDLVKGG